MSITKEKKRTFTRAELLHALRIEPCHTTGMHNPSHTTNYVCDLQLTKAFERVLTLLGVIEEDLPRLLHEECGWCHHPGEQETFREERRQLYKWAGVPIPPALVKPAPDARETEENEKRRTGR